MKDAKMKLERDKNELQRIEDKIQKNEELK